MAPLYALPFCHSVLDCTGLTASDRACFFRFIPQSEPGEPVVEICAGRHEDHRDVGELGVRLEQPARRVPVEPRHRDIEQDHGRVLRARRVQDQVAGRDSNRDISRTFETSRHDSPLVGLILSDEDLRASCRGDCRRRRPHRWAGEVLGEGLPDRSHDITRERCIEGVAAGGVNQLFQLGGAGADRGKPDRPGEAAQSMDHLLERRDRPSRAERRHLVNEDTDGLALGHETGDETMPRFVQDPLEVVGGGSSGRAVDWPTVRRHGPHSSKRRRPKPWRRVARDHPESGSD